MSSTGTSRRCCSPVRRTRGQLRKIAASGIALLHKPLRDDELNDANPRPACPTIRAPGLTLPGCHGPAGLGVILRTASSGQGAGHLRGLGPVGHVECPKNR